VIDMNLADVTLCSHCRGPLLDYGFTTGEVKFDWKLIKAKRDAYIDRLTGIYEVLCVVCCRSSMKVSLLVCLLLLLFFLSCFAQRPMLSPPSDHYTLLCSCPPPSLPRCW
jgi:hypothetical protein